MTDARTDWERRIYRRLTDTSSADPGSRCRRRPACWRDARHGHVRLAWDAGRRRGGLPDRAHRAATASRTSSSHGGSDVPAVAGTAFADTGARGRRWTYRYRVGAVAGAEYPAWHWTAPVDGQRPVTAGPARSRSPSTPPATPASSTGSGGWSGRERLTQLRFGDDGNGHDIGAEFAEALRIAHDDLGVAARPGARDPARRQPRRHPRRRRRRSPSTSPSVDELYDQILALGIRPVVELSFMPAAIAARSRADRVRLPRHHLPAARLGRVARAGRRAGRATWSTATASTRSPSGASRSGTSPTSRCSGPAPRTTTSACTTRRRAR